VREIVSGGCLGALGTAAALGSVINPHKDTTMSNGLQTIDLFLLERASGGAGEGAGPNQTNINGNISVETPVGIKASGQGSYQSAETDYARCLGLAAAGGAKPADFAAICGKPGGQ
jgi:hypothetical protein